MTECRKMQASYDNRGLASESESEVSAVWRSIGMR